MKQYPEKKCPVCGKTFASMFKTCSRKCGSTLTTSPYQERAKARTWRDGDTVDTSCVPNAADLAAFDRMCAERPLKPPPCRFAVSPAATPGAVAARKDRNGVA